MVLLYYAACATVFYYGILTFMHVMHTLYPLHFCRVVSKILRITFRALELQHSEYFHSDYYALYCICGIFPPDSDIYSHQAHAVGMQ